MRRWFVIVFTLHFFFSVGAFAFGHIDIHPPGNEQSRAVAAWVADVQDPSHDDDLLGAAPDHGLTDSQPDLPDIIKPVVLVLAVGRPQPAPAGAVWVPPISPTLEGPQRPPRFSPIHA